MEAVTQKYLSDPTLVWGLTIAVIALFALVIWLIKFQLNKMIVVLESVATSNLKLTTALSELRTSIEEGTEATTGLLQEQKLLNQQLQISINRKP